MEPWIFRFKAEGTVDYSQLTFDPGQNELIVGARYCKPYASLFSFLIFLSVSVFFPSLRSLSFVVCPFIVLSFISHFFSVCWCVA